LSPVQLHAIFFLYGNSRPQSKTPAQPFDRLQCCTMTIANIMATRRKAMNIQSRLIILYL
jgi:hypothetical protein